MKCPNCGLEGSLFDVYLESKGYKDKYMHTLCCKCRSEVKK